MRVGGEGVPLETIGLEGDDPFARTSHVEDASWLAFADQTAFGENELAVVTLTAMSVLEQATRRLVQISGVIYALVIAVLGVIVVWMTKTLSDPLRHLADQAEKFGKGDYYTEIKVDTQDETGRLAAVINESRKNIGSKMVALGATKRALERQYQESEQLLGITSGLTAELDLDVLLAEIISVTTKILAAERGSLFMYDPDADELWSRVAGGQESHETIRFSASAGIAGACMTSGECINIPDAYEDSRFNQDVDKRTGFLTRTILCMPILSKTGKKIAVVQVLNKRVGTFTEQDEARLSAFSAQAAIALENAQLFETVDNMARSFERFVPVEFIKALGRESALEIEVGDGVSREITVFFSDIRGFTTLSEGMSAEQLLRFVNELFEYITPAIHNHGGFIDKLIGDAVMALFSVSADEAVRAAIGVRQGLLSFNRERRGNGASSVDIGIGLHTGELMLGTVGSVRRLDTTVIGDTVNLASRLEGVTKFYGVPIIISSATHERLKDPAAFRLRDIDMVRVKGKTEPVTLYESFDCDPPEVAHGKTENLDLFREAIEAYRAGQFADALEAFSSCARSCPQDMLTTLYVSRCEQHLGEAPDEEWTGITSLTEK